MSNDDFLKELQAAFQAEAAEHLQGITSGLLELERGGKPEDLASLVERIYRQAHSLKGAARAVDASGVERICQSMEGVFARWKRAGATATPESFDRLQEALDVVGALLTDPAAAPESKVALLVEGLDAVEGPTRRAERPEPAPPPRPEPREEARSVVAVRAQDAVAVPRMELRASSEAAPAAPLEPPQREAASVGPAPAPSQRVAVTATGGESVRIAVGKLGALFTRAEELIAAKQVIGLRRGDVRRLQGRAGEWRKALDEREAAADAGAGGTASLTADVRLFLDGLQRDLFELSENIAADHRSVSRMVDDLLDDARQVLLQPFSSLADLMPKVARDLSRDLGKKVELHVEGAEVEIDRRILEALKDPFIHLIRNCLDHGIEAPEERLRRGKPEAGSVRITIRQAEGSKVEVRVTDDGRGVDLPRVKRKAVERGIISEREASDLDDRSALNLIFASDLSTSPIVTEISGRGLGLAIVRESVETIGGSVDVTATPGQGTEFVLLFPVTLATFRGVVVRVAGRVFVVPSVYVERVFSVPRSEVRTAENRETVPVDGRPVSLVDLAVALDLPPSTDRADGDSLTMALVAAGGQRVAFLVDAVLYEQEGLAKGLGAQLKRVRNVSGATVMGREGLIPILNSLDLLTTARLVSGRGRSAVASQEKVERKVKAVLVAEDSITSRMLLKSVLEAAGYRVSTAVDGAEAYAMLKSEPFDALISDVEMPRLDGFELTRRVRQDSSLAELPVVLVTGLSSREHREKGVEVGANAYIVKSSFDQSNLLSVLSRLV
jgi:two-component system chemotaxis sensor kinase CheA